MKAVDGWEFDNVAGFLPLVRDDHPVRLYSRTDVFATDGSNPDS